VSSLGSLSLSVVVLASKRLPFGLELRFVSSGHITSDVSSHARWVAFRQHHFHDILIPGKLMARWKMRRRQKGHQGAC